MIRRINQRRAVFETYLLGAAVLTGTTGLLVPATRSRSIVTAFPHWAQGLWYLGMLVGSAVAFVGIVMKCPQLSLHIERAGLSLLAGLCLSFALASFGYAGLVAIPGTVLLGGFAGASIARGFQISSELREIEVFRRAGRLPSAESP